ncbi:MAG: hypothetical protein ACEPO8_05915 [Rhodothermaceae bacterium]
MELVFGKNKTLFTSLGIDILAFAIIALAPALSHLSGIPLYYAEPFRIALFILLIYFHVVFKDNIIARWFSLFIVKTLIV